MVSGLILAFLIIPTQIKDVDVEWYNSPRLFPWIISGLFVVLGAALFFSGRKKARTMPDSEQEVYSLPWEKAKMVLLFLLIIVLYVISMEFLPYIPCTIVALAVMMLVAGQRSWIKLGAVSIILPIVIYYSFTMLLKLRLP